MEPDEVLVERAKKDPGAFGELYERYIAKVYSYVYYRTGSQWEAEDLTEKVFLQALGHLQGYVDRGLPFSVWLLRIAHNLVVNWYRDRRRRPVAPLDDGQLPHEEEGLDRLEMAEDMAIVRKAVSRLPQERQHLIMLKYFEGLSNAEIGQAMGRSEGAVKALLHRTLKTLKDWIDDETKGPEGP